MGFRIERANEETGSELNESDVEDSVSPNRLDAVVQTPSTYLQYTA